MSRGERPAYPVTVSAGIRYSTSVASWLATSLPWDRLLAAALSAALEQSVLCHGLTAGWPRLGPSWGWTAAVAVVGAAMTLMVAARRRQPQWTWAIATACGSFLLSAPTQLGLPYMAGPGYGPGMITVLRSVLLVLPAPAVALYTVTRAGRARRGCALAGSMVALVLLPLLLANLQWQLSGPTLDIPQQRANTWPFAVLVAGTVVAAWALGEAVCARSRMEAAERAMEAAKRAGHDRDVAADERARIAAELHDITAHHISVVSLQAGTARLLAEQGQPPSVELLAGIEAASRQAMAEIRQALGVIRAGPDGAAPLPGLAQVPDLAARMALAGLTVTVDGSAGLLPGSTDLTAYRIVQEGLANVARHSVARRAAVTFRRETGTLHLTIADDGPARDGTCADQGGNGLIGLRERVRRHGGRMRAGPGPSGGFELHAELPLGDGARNPVQAQRETEPAP
jgi:signal transduction histidine kinase